MAALDERAIQANAVACELADERRYAEAIPHSVHATELEPNWWAPWANLGVQYKHVGEFPACLRACLRAWELDAHRAGTGTLWNLAVAATALGDWQRARWAWKECGVPVPDGVGPIEMRIGITPIRVNVNVAPEVVWTKRIDPARAIIESIPFPSSGRRYRDLLLHDGEPRGHRTYGGQRLSVFNELALLEASPYATWRVYVEAPAAGDVESLLRACRDIDGALEDWTSSREVFCKKCSEGVPHERHETVERTAEPVWLTRREIAVAARDEGALTPIRDWASIGKGRSAGPAERLI